VTSDDETGDGRGAQGGRTSAHRTHADGWFDGTHDPVWDTDHIELTSVGIDVGSATAQVMFSRLALHRLGRELSSRYVVVRREVLYRSPVHLTPYSEALLIDEQKIRALVAEAFAAAGLARDDVDTGAVILTGEANRRENARAIADMFADESGAFVCATAGHHMEATLAAHGSGAVSLGRGVGRRILNIDIGGGTTKFAVVEDGEVAETAALHVGGRLAAFDDEHGILRLEPAGQRIAAMAEVSWELGGTADATSMDRVAERMADLIVAAADGALSEDVVELLLTPGLSARGTYDAVLFSGGVSEYVYGRESDSYGDLGPLLGRALAQRQGALPGPVREAAGGILATVLGASQYTVQVSGNTIYVSDPHILPLHNLQVVYPRFDLGGPMVDAVEVGQALTRHLAKLNADLDGDLAFAFHWEGPPSYARLSALVEGVEQALAERLAAGLPVCLLFEGDVARSIGAMLKEDRGHPGPVISVDGVTVTDFEFIDVGALLERSRTLPISIKSLMFHL
jgi:ethanolamine utilization protein EutA